MLPAGNRVQIVADGGHFLQVQQAETVRDAVLSFAGTPSSPAS